MLREKGTSDLLMTSDCWHHRMTKCVCYALWGVVPCSRVVTRLQPMSTAQSFFVYVELLAVRGGHNIAITTLLFLYICIYASPHKEAVPQTALVLADEDLHNRPLYINTERETNQVCIFLTFVSTVFNWVSRTSSPCSSIFYTFSQLHSPNSWSDKLVLTHPILFFLYYQVMKKLILNILESCFVFWLKFSGLCGSYLNVY